MSVYSQYQQSLSWRLADIRGGDDKMNIELNSATIDMLEVGVSGSSCNHLLWFIDASSDNFWLACVADAAKAELKRRLASGDRMEFVTADERRRIEAL